MTEKCELNPNLRWYPLWKLLQQEHGLNLLDGELHDIVDKVLECQVSMPRMGDPAPGKIYLNISDEEPASLCEPVDWGEVTWSEKPAVRCALAYVTEHQLTKALAEVERLREIIRDDLSESYLEQ